MKKEEQRRVVLTVMSEHIKKLDSYHEEFLSTMLLRKLRHPEEGLREIITKVRDSIKTRIPLSLAKTLVDIEIALDEAEFSEEMKKARGGNTVKFVFDYLSKKIRDKMESLAEE